MTEYSKNRNYQRTLQLRYRITVIYILKNSYKNSPIFKFCLEDYEK